MTAAFAYLTACSVRNMLVRRARRLRQPRYALGLLAAAAYFYSFMLRPRIGRAAHAVDLIAQLQRHRAAVELAMTMVLIVVLLVLWLVPIRRVPLEFTRPEIQFLFPAPIERSRLIHYKLLRSQLGILFGSLVVSFFTGRLQDPTRWPMIAGYWILFSVLHFHQIASGQFYHHLKQTESPVRKLAIVWLVAAVVIGVVVVSVVPPLRNFSGQASDLPDLGRELVVKSQEMPITVLVFPVRVLAAPLLAVSGFEFIRALPWALLLVLLHYFWVVRSQVAFEEAAAEAAERKAQRKALARARVTEVPEQRRSAPFLLQERGRPEWAFLWKNWMLHGRALSARRIGLILLAAAMMALLVAYLSPMVAGGFLGIAATFTVMLPLFGPHAIRNDLRRDLLQLELYKTFPLSGRTIVLGEMLAPILLLVVLIWSLLLLVAVLASGVRSGFVGIGTGPWQFFAAALALPGLGALGVLIQNALALAFPAWISPGHTRSTGFEAMGQGIVLMIVSLILLLALLLVPAVAATVVALGGYWLLGWAALVPAALVSLLVMLGEVFAAAVLLGQLFERTDPQQLERVEV